MFCSFFISDIKEEDLPIYVGSGAGILLLLFVLVGVASWRCTRPTAVSVQRASQNKEQGTAPTLITIFLNCTKIGNQAQGRERGGQMSLFKQTHV